MITLVPQHRHWKIASVTRSKLHNDNHQQIHTIKVLSQSFFASQLKRKRSQWPLEARQPLTTLGLRDNTDCTLIMDTTPHRPVVDEWADYAHKHRNHHAAHLSIAPRSSPYYPLLNSFQTRPILIASFSDRLRLYSDRSTICNTGFIAANDQFEDGKSFKYPVTGVSSDFWQILMAITSISLPMISPSGCSGWAENRSDLVAIPLITLGRQTHSERFT